MTLREFVRTFEEMRSPLLELVRRERPYKIPKGYLRWESLSALIAVCLDRTSAKYQDRATALHMARSVLWFVQNAPIYCLSTKLIQAFDQTDIHDHQELLADLHPPLPTFILLFPQGLIRTPEGSAIDYCVVHLADNAKPELSEGQAFGLVCKHIPHEHDRNLHWSSADSEECVWFSGVGLLENGTLLHSDEQLGMQQVDSRERLFLRRMRSIVLQCLLTLTYRPDLLSNTEQAHPPNHSRGKGEKHKSKSPSIMLPRWIGKEYERSSKPGSGTHAIPREHWRRGHWRRVVQGKREEGARKWVWIEPTFVRGK